MATTTLLVVAAVALRAVQGQHVTRLHRYDHSGLESMMEIEAQWQRDVLEWKDRSAGGIGDVAPHRALRSGNRARHGPAAAASLSSFVQMSAIQVNALRDHHRDVARETARSFGNDTASSLVEKLHDYTMAKPGLHAGHAVTGLSCIGSQYVGQIGVGTMVKPDNCVVDPTKELVYVGEEKASVLLQMNSTACHMVDESHALMVFDTGSTNIWVPDVNCKGACAKPERNRYDQKMSATYHSPESMIQLAVQFGTGKVEGTQAIDTFHLGEGLAVRDQTFGKIESETGAVFETSPFDGIWGLAGPKMSANGVVPSFDNIIKQGVLAENQFTFYMHPTNPSANAILWGKHDAVATFQATPFNTHKVDKLFYWRLPLDSFTIGDEAFFGRGAAGPAALLEQGEGTAETKQYAIMDTGTTFCTAEDGVYQKIMARIPAVQCSARTETSHPPITWNMRAEDGEIKAYTMTNSEYMTSDGQGSDQMCTPAFMKINIPTEQGPAMVLGEVFDRKFLTQYRRGATGADNEASVGIALARHDDNSLNTVKSLTQGQGFSKSVASRLRSKDIPVPPAAQSASISKPL